MGKKHYRITLADAFVAHDAAMSFGGREGVVSLHSIESAIARPYSGYHLRIHNKAAALMESMVNNHGFVDGNKRTAWLLVELLIERSGYFLAISDDAPIDDIVVGVASGEIAHTQLVRWFKGNIERA